MLPVITLALLPIALTPTVEPVPTIPTVTQILPADTPLVGMVNTQSQAWESVNRFVLFQKTIAAISPFIPQVKFNYEQDVKSWLGDEVAIAFLPKSGATPASVTQAVMLATIKDETRLQPLFNKLKADTPRTQQQQYRGVTILEMKVSPPEKPLIAPPPQSKLVKLEGLKTQAPTSLAVAVLPQYIVGGYDVKAIKQIIDISRTKTTTLAQNPDFQKSIKNSQAGALVSMYQNPATFIPLIEDIAKDVDLPISLMDLNFLRLEVAQKYSSINSTFAVDPQGLRLQIKAYNKKPESINLSVSNPQKQKILSLMPAATYSSITDRNLNQKWQSIAKVLSVQPDLNTMLTQFRGFVQAGTGLDFDRDIMSWMDGEYGFFFYPTKGGLLNLGNTNSKMGIGLTVQTSNRTAAETTLRKLNNLVKSQKIAVNHSKIKGQAVTSWNINSDAAQSLLAYSWINDDTIVITTGYGAIADLVPQPYVSLPSAYNFRNATNSLPHPNEGYFYVNMGSMLSWIYGFIPPQYSNSPFFQPIKEIVGSVYSVSATTAIAPESEQFDFLLVLAPMRK